MVFTMKNPKYILITGASSGIGEALALHYAASDVFLALTGRNIERLQTVADRCRAQGATVVDMIVDVADQQAMETWILDVFTESPLDLVIANAGISGGTSDRDDGEPVSEARTIFDVNVTGVFNTIEPALKIMQANGGKGQIAVTSSLAGFRGWPSAPAYSASKGAVRFYGEALRGSLKATGIEVNVICASTDPEGFGRVPVEAQAMGRPIIATDHGGAQETIIRNETGWLVPPGDADAMARAIEEALDLTPEQRSILATRSMAHIAEYFTCDKMADQTLNVYAELLQEKYNIPSFENNNPNLLKSAAE